MTVNTSLHSRLRNCLQTILELHDGLNSPLLSHAFTRELELIRKFLLRLDAIELQEEDARRIERATEAFLRELRGLFAAGLLELADLPDLTDAADPPDGDAPARLQ